MFVILGILTISVLIIWFEWPKLSKNGEKKATWTFFILLLIGTSLNIAIALDLTIPSPQEVIIFIYEPVGEFLIKSLK